MLFSPNFPSNYPLGSSCKWEIIGDPRDNLNIEIQQLQLAGGEKQKNVKPVMFI